METLISLISLSPGIPEAAENRLGDDEILSGFIQVDTQATFRGHFYLFCTECFLNNPGQLRQ